MAAQAPVPPTPGALLAVRRRTAAATVIKSRKTKNPAALGGPVVAVDRVVDRVVDRAVAEGQAAPEAQAKCPISMK